MQAELVGSRIQRFKDCAGECHSAIVLSAGARPDFIDVAHVIIMHHAGISSSMPCCWQDRIIKGPLAAAGGCNTATASPPVAIFREYQIPLDVCLSEDSVLIMICFSIKRPSSSARPKGLGCIAACTGLIISRSKAGWNPSFLA